MKNHIKFALVTLILGFMGCSDDFLDIEPTGSQLPKEGFLKTEEEVITALVGAYDIMQDNYSNTGWNSAYFVKNLPGDDVLCGSSSADQPKLQGIDDFEIEADNPAITSIWTNMYKVINSCNTITEVVGDFEGASTGVLSAAGEAKAIRALTYFDLVVLFGKVPLFVENPTNSVDYHQPRAAVADVYAQIEKDLTEAIAVLPKKSEYSADLKFRFSKGAAQALLGKVYMYQEETAKALEQFEKVFTSGEYSLEPNFIDVWKPGNEFGSESLFEVSYTSVGNIGWEFGWDHTDGNIQIQLEGPRDNVLLGSTTLDLQNGWGFNNPTAKIGDLILADGGDRYTGTLISEADLFATGAGWDPDKGPLTHDYEGYFKMKYTTKKSESVDVAWFNYTVNWKILRYADVILLAAEAYSLQGNDTKALGLLNDIRSRAGLADATATGTALLEAIKLERFKELAFEGQRFWDLVRWGDASKELASEGFETGKHEVFPIPMNEIIANKSISESDQNPGY